MSPAKKTTTVRHRPPTWALLLESRAMLDVATLPARLLASKLRRRDQAGALPIIMFPGFSSDERYMRALEYYLRDQGYQTEGWGLGRNMAGLDMPHKLEDLSAIWEFEPPPDYSPETYRGEGGVPFLAEKAIARVKQRASELGSPVVLIGWSLGGFLVRECARELPEEVAHIITFGAPVYGGPKYSRAAAVFEARKQNLDWIEQSIEKRHRKPITQPITSIYSKSDGIVSWTAAVDDHSPNVENVEVNASHLGMGFNRQVWQVVSRALAEQAQLRVQA